MPITIPIEVKKINRLLVDHFGIDTSTGQPMWRVVWSDDQYEKRLTDRIDSGLQLLHPEVRELPKYKQWIPHRWVLEQLVVVPYLNEKDLPATKLSYEPMFPFEDKQGNFLPPNFEACKFVVDLVNSAKGRSNMAKYKDPELEPGAQEAKINRIEKELFGDENDVTDALAYKEGVAINNTDFKIKES